jgi:hypothetical protein
LLSNTGVIPPLCQREEPTDRRRLWPGRSTALHGQPCAEIITGCYGAFCGKGVLGQSCGAGACSGGGSVCFGDGGCSPLVRSSGVGEKIEALDTCV